MNCVKCGKSAHSLIDTFCSDCGSLLSSAAPENLRRPKNDLAWESILRDSPFLGSLFHTVIVTILHPDRFFRKAVERNHPFHAAWLYGIIVGNIGLLASWFWSGLLFRHGSASLLGNSYFGQDITSPFTLLFSPFLISLHFVLIAAYASIAFRMGCSKRVPFSQVFRICCYAETPVVLSVIPVAGTAAAAVLWVYTVLTGFHHLYAVRRTKAFVLLTLPVIVLCAGVLVIAAAVMTGASLVGPGRITDWFTSGRF